MPAKCPCAAANANVQALPAFEYPLSLCKREQAACGHTCAAVEATWLHARAHLCSSTSASGSATAVPAFSTMSITSLTRMEAQTWAASSGLPPMSNEKPYTEGDPIWELGLPIVMVQGLQRGHHLFLCHPGL